MKWVMTLICGISILASLSALADDGDSRTVYASATGYLSSDPDNHFMKNTSFTELRSQCMNDEELTSYWLSEGNGANLYCEDQYPMNDKFCTVSSVGICTKNTKTYTTYAAPMTYSAADTYRTDACATADQDAAFAAGKQCEPLARATQTGALPGSCSCLDFTEPHGHQCRSEGWATCEIIPHDGPAPSLPTLDVSAFMRVDDVRDAKEASSLDEGIASNASQLHGDGTTVAK